MCGYACMLLFRVLWFAVWPRRLAAAGQRLLVWFAGLGGWASARLKRLMILWGAPRGRGEGMVVQQCMCWWWGCVEQWRQNKEPCPPAAATSREVGYDMQMQPV